MSLMSLDRQISIPEESSEEEPACPKEPELLSDLGMGAKHFVEKGPVWFGMSPLESELGQRMQHIVEAEYWQRLEPVLESELGQRMQHIVEAEYWQLLEPVLESELGQRIQRIVEAEYRQKTEEYAEIEQEYSLDHDAYRDGPALTEDGCVVDLDGGSPIYFASDPALSDGHFYKTALIKAVKHAKCTQLHLDTTNAAAEVDAATVCGIDPDGILHGHESLSWKSALATKQAAADARERIKRFHKKGNRCQQRKKNTSDGTPAAVCIDPTGKASLLLYLASKKPQKHKLRRKEFEESTSVFVLDVNGAIQDSSMDA
jgi:hypothetical protein